MQLTLNYNLKKPEDTDPIDAQDLNNNMDIIDAELKNRPVGSGGDISGMTVKTLETITTEFPVPVAGESTKTFLGKVQKFFKDTKNWMTGVCLLGQIVNNCVTDRSDLPLSAAQGKALMDLYTVLNTNFTVRYNSDTDYIQVHYNDTWNDFIRAFMRHIKIYYLGVLSEGCILYNNTTNGHTGHSEIINNVIKLEGCFDTGNYGAMYTPLIDLTDKAKIKMKYRISNTNRPLCVHLNDDYAFGIAQQIFSGVAMSDTEIEIDLTQYTGDKSLCFWVQGGMAVSSYAYISEILIL